MVRGKSEVWKHFKVDGKRSTCNFCGKQAYKNPSRMPLHLTKCAKCPEPIKERMLAELPKSVCKTTSSISQCVVGSNDNNSSSDFDNAEIEVINEEENEVENVIFMPTRYKYNSKRSEDTVATKFIEDAPKDEFTLFGNTVAHKLRNINNARARVIAQYYINTVLFRAEMTNFNEDVSLPPLEEFSLFDSVYQESVSKENKYEPSESAS